MRQHILYGTLGQASATQTKNSMDPNVPFASPLEYLRALASLTRLYWGEVDRKTYCAGKSLATVLWCAGASDRVQWALNNQRLRHSCHPAHLPLLGSGTSPNESLHHELNTWFRNQPEVYSTTLGQQLEINEVKNCLPTTLRFILRSTGNTSRTLCSPQRLCGSGSTKPLGGIIALRRRDPTGSSRAPSCRGGKRALPRRPPSRSGRCGGRQQRCASAPSSARPSR